MSDIQVISLAMQRAQWLSARQSIVAQNIANANTPAYKARDILPFAAELQNTALALEVTKPGHIMPENPSTSANATTEVKGDATFNGNTVSLEGEMAKLGETSSQYALTTSIIKSFHKMIMTSLKV